MTRFVYALGLLLMATSAGAQVRFPVEKYQLANGLTVLLQPDNSVPLIAYHMWFRVGSKNEEVGRTGIAHLFEHLSYLGTKRYANKDYENILQENGAVNNAFTSHDYTGYYVILPSSKLELVADMESDRLINLDLTEANLKSEREVVKEERRVRVDNSPGGILSEGVFATLFKVHPYRWPLSGYMKDLDAITLDQAKQFYKTYYAPNNAVLVLAGDFNPSAAKKIIEKYYGAIPSQLIPAAHIVAEPEQKAQRETVLTRQFQTTMWSVAYPTPKLGHDDNFALDLIANILGRGTSSRLYKRLVDQAQLATSVVVDTESLQDPGFFEVIVALKPGVDVNKVQEIVYNQVWQLRNHLVDDKELLKVKNQTMFDFVEGLKTAQGKARALAFNEVMLGNYEYLFKDLDRYNAVTKEQIKDVASRYLNQNQRNLVRLEPKPKETQTAELTQKDHL